MKKHMNQLIRFGFAFTILCFPVLIWAQICNDYIPVSTPNTDFIVHNNGTVTHSETGLMWDRCAQGQTGDACENGQAEVHNWQMALNIVATKNNEHYRGYNDWRLPNVKELLSIIETSCDSPAVNLNIFPGIPDSYNGRFYSSTIKVFDNAMAEPISMMFNITDNISYRTYEVGPSFIRLVRGGKTFDAFDIYGDASDTLPDTDGDGENNLAENYAGTDATDPNSNVKHWIGLPTGYQGTITDLLVLDNNTLFAIGEMGLLCSCSHDSVWQIIDLRYAHEPWTAIWGTDSSHIYLGSRNGLMLYFDGQTIQTLDLSDFGLAQVTDIWGTAPDNVFVTGTNGVLLHFDGRQWQRVDTGTDVTLWQVWGTAPNDIYAVGDQGMVIYFNGTIWQTIDVYSLLNTQAAREGFAFKCIWKDENGVIYLISDAGNSVYAPSQNGQWSILDIEFYGKAIWGNNPNNLYISSGNKIYHYNGETWAEVVENFRTLSLTGLPNGSVYAAGEDGVIHMAAATGDGQELEVCNNMMDFDTNGVVGYHDVRLIKDALYQLARGGVTPDPRLDVNCDGKVDETDQSLVETHRGQISNTSCQLATTADLDGDGSVGHNDVQLVKDSQYKTWHDKTDFDPAMDLNCDGFINDADVTFVEARIGQINVSQCNVDTSADLNQNGIVARSDLKIVKDAIYKISRNRPFNAAADTNCDARVNEEDITFIERYLGQISTANCQVAVNADLDGNGIVTKQDQKIVSDAMYRIDHDQTNFNWAADTNCDGWVNETDMAFIELDLGKILHTQCVVATSGDLDGDGTVGYSDEQIVKTAIYKIAQNQTDFNPLADTNCDSVVDDTDLNYVQKQR